MRRLLVGLVQMVWFISIRCVLELYLLYSQGDVEILGAEMIVYIVIGVIGFCLGNIFQIIIKDW